MPRQTLPTRRKPGAWHRLSVGAALILLTFGLAGKGHAQRVLLPPPEAMPELQEAQLPGSPAIVIISAAGIEGLSEAQANRRYPLGQGGRLILAVAALSLVERGQWSLDTDMSTLLPDLVEEAVFTTPVTLASLLSGTSGYMVPPWYRGAPWPDSADGETQQALARQQSLAPYMIKLRRAGQIPSDDVVGWALLAEALYRHYQSQHTENRQAQSKPENAVSGLPATEGYLDKSRDPQQRLAGFLAWLQAEITRHLGINIVGDEADLKLNDDLDNIPPPFHPVLGLTASGRLIAKIALRILLAVEKPAGGGGTSLIGERLWSLHPLGSWRLAGLAGRYQGDRPQLSLPDTCPGALEMLLLPQNGLGFIALPPALPPALPTDKTAPLSPCAGAGNRPALSSRLAPLIAAYIPPPSQSRVASATASLADTLARLSRWRDISGWYLRENRPSAWLKERLNSVREEAFFLVDKAPEVLELRRGGVARQFAEIAPLQYREIKAAQSETGAAQTAEAAGAAHQTDGGNATLTLFAEGGGYFMLEGDVYRFADTLGDENLMLSPLFWMLGLLATGGIYWLMGHDRPWRFMGAFCFGGAALSTAGLYFEVNFWPTALLAYNAPVLVLLWRLLSLFGLMMTLSIPMFALRFAKQGNMPRGFGYVLAPFHLTLLTAAACILVLLHVAWGYAGALWPL